MEIPFYPDYSIDSHGAVYGPSGRRLSVSKEGKVKLYKDGKRREEYVGDLLLAADGMKSDMYKKDAEQKIAKYKEEADRKIAYAEKAIAAKEEERRYAIRRLCLARRANAHLLAMIRREQPDMNLSELCVEEQ